MVGLVLVSVLAWAFHLELFRSVLVCYHVTSTVYRVFVGLHIHKSRYCYYDSIGSSGPVWSRLALPCGVVVERIAERVISPRKEHELDDGSSRRFGGIGTVVLFLQH